MRLAQSPTETLGCSRSVLGLCPQPFFLQQGLAVTELIEVFLKKHKWNNKFSPTGMHPQPAHTHPGEPSSCPFFPFLVADKGGPPSIVLGLRSVSPWLRKTEAMKRPHCSGPSSPRASQAQNHKSKDWNCGCRWHGVTRL